MTVFRLLAVSLIAFVLLTSCSRKKEVRVYPMGDKAEIGPFQYQAYETKWPLSLGERTPKDRFLIIKVNILNSGAADALVPSMQVVDDAGNAYSESMDGSGLESWMGLSRKLAVGENEAGYILFDVPPKHYKLRVADEADNFVYIDIPLNLITEEPDKVDGVTK